MTLKHLFLGLQIGLYNANFKIENMCVGEMRLYNNTLKERQDKINARKIYELYANKIKNINKVIDDLNRDLI